MAAVIREKPESRRIRSAKQSSTARYIYWAKDYTDEAAVLTAAGSTAPSTVTVDGYTLGKREIDASGQAAASPLRSFLDPKRLITTGLRIDTNRSERLTTTIFEALRLAAAFWSG